MRYVMRLSGYAICTICRLVPLPKKLEWIRPRPWTILLSPCSFIIIYIAFRLMLIYFFRLVSIRGHHLLLLSSRSFHSLAFVRSHPNHHQQHRRTIPSILTRNMSDEVAKAQAASLDDGPTIFDKLLSKEIPSTCVYEDDISYCFKDVNPQAPFHALVIPKKKDGLIGLSSMKEDQKDLVGHLMWVAQKVGKEQCPNGFRVVINDGKDGAQSVSHLHLHVIGGRQMGWPPG